MYMCTTVRSFEATAEMGNGGNENGGSGDGGNANGGTGGKPYVSPNFLRFTQKLSVSV